MVLVIFFDYSYFSKLNTGNTACGMRHKATIAFNSKQFANRKC